MKNKKIMWQIRQAANAGTLDLYIYGDVESDYLDWWTWDIVESETSANKFREELNAHPDVQQINIYINSYGGSVFEGTAIFNQLKRHPAHKTVYVDGFNPAVLLDGGEYEPGDRTGACDGSGETSYCNGLRKALAYFVYAKMLRNDGNIIARAGAMQHNDQYAMHTNDPELKRYNDTMSIAEKYLAESMEYANMFKPAKRHVRGSRCRILAIGD